MNDNNAFMQNIVTGLQQRFGGNLSNEQIASMLQYLQSQGITPSSSYEDIGRAMSSLQGGLSNPGWGAGGGSATDRLLQLLTGQTEKDREMQAADLAIRAQMSRTATGVGMLDYIQSLAQDYWKAEQDPYRIGEDLYNRSQLPAGSGNPVAELIGRGVSIKPQLPQPLQDPRYQALLDDLLKFGRPQQASQTGQTPQFAGGGSMMTNEPIMGMGMMSGKPRFMMGEAGPEMMKITPLKKFAGGGQVQIGNEGFVQGGDLTYEKVKAIEAANAANPYYQSLKTGYNMPNATARNEYFIKDFIDRYNPGYNVVYDASENRGGPWFDSRTNTYHGDPLYDRTAPGQIFPDRAQMALSNLDRVNTLRRTQPGYNDRYLQMLQSFGYGADTRGGGDTGELGPPNTAPAPPGGAPPNAPPGTSVTPAQASAMALGKSLQTNPFAPPELVQALLRNEPPPPGAITERLWRNLDPVTRDLLMSVAQQFGYKPESMGSSMGQYWFGGYRPASVTL